MPIFYNDIAGQHIGRLANLSDSIFGVAMTLLILEVRLPVGDIKSEQQLWGALVALYPLGKTVFFAGEHTDDRPGPGGMEGAIKSGYRVADEILHSA